MGRSGDERDPAETQGAQRFTKTTRSREQVDEVWNERGKSQIQSPQA